MSFIKEKNPVNNICQRENALFVLLLFAVSIVVCWSLFRNQFPDTYDHGCSLSYHLAIRNFFGRGQLLPVWVSDFNNGYGGALFDFYPPLFYLASASIDALGVPVALAINLTCFLVMFLSGWSMFVFLKDLINEDSAFIGAAAYMMAPYHTFDLYDRGAYAEFTAFIFLPLIFWGIRKVARTPYFHYIFITALAVVGLLLSHTISALFFLPLAVLYALFVVGMETEGRFKKLGIVFFAFLAGLAMAAFSVLPAIWERKYVNLEPYFTGWYDYQRNFIHPAQLLFSPKEYNSWLGVSLANRQPFEFGWFYLLLFIVGAACLLFSASKVNKKNYVYFLLALLVTLWMMTVYSRNAWALFPSLRMMQFPWRLLELASFFVCLFIAGIGAVPWARYRRILCILAVFLIIIVRISDFKTLGWLPPVSKSPQALKVLQEQGGDSQPISAKYNISTHPDYLLDFPKGVGEILSYQQISPVVHRFQILAQTPLISCYYNFYFPGWEIDIDGKKTPFIDNAYGLMLFAVPMGLHQISIHFSATRAHIIGDIISLLCLLCMILILILKRKKLAKP